MKDALPTRTLEPLPLALEEEQVVVTLCEASEESAGPASYRSHRHLIRRVSKPFEPFMPQSKKNTIRMRKYLAHEHLDAP